MLLNFLWIFIVCFRVVTAKSDPGNKFINPPASGSGETLDYAAGQRLAVSWTTTLNVFNISIRQESPNGDSGLNGGTIFSKINPEDDLTNFTWVVQTFDFDLSASTTFFLSVDSHTSDGFISDSFTITSPDPATSSSSPSIPSTPASIEAASASDTAATSSGMTSTGKIAIGLGVGVGVPLISLLAILAFLQYRSAQKQYVQSNLPMAHALPLPPPSQYANPPLFRSYGPAELGPKSRSGTPLGTKPESRTRTFDIPELSDHNYHNYI